MRNCKLLIEDFTQVKEDADGGKLKAKVKDKSGVSYEKYGHFCDTADYILCEAFRNYYEN